MIKLSDYENTASTLSVLLSTDIRQAIRQGRVDERGAPSFITADGDGNTRHLVHFDTAINDAATNNLDRLKDETSSVYTGTYWKMYNGASLSNAWFKFGTKSLLLGGGNDFVQTVGNVSQYRDTVGWTEEFVIKTGLLSASRRIFRGHNSTGYGVSLSTTSAGVLRVYLSSTGTGWNIANAEPTTQTMLSNTEYHIAIVYDNVEYRVYVDGVLVYTKVSGSPICKISKRTFGWSSYAMDGYVDEYRFSTSAIYTAAFTPPASPFTLLPSLKVNVVADAEYPLRLSFSEGSTEYGRELNEGLLSQDLVPSNTNYLYLDYNKETAQVTLGSTIVPPQYGTVFDRSRHSLLAFDGASDPVDQTGYFTFDQQTPTTDLYGNLWIETDIELRATTATSRPRAKFNGSTSYMISDLAALPRRWTMKVVHTVDVGSDANTGLLTFGRNVNGYGIRVMVAYNSADQSYDYKVSLSTNGTSWDLASGATVVGGQAGVTNTFTLSFDGSRYIFRNRNDSVETTWSSTEEIVASKDALIELGRDYTTASGYYHGYIHEFELQPFVKRVPEPYDELATPTKIRNDIHFFDISKMEMRLTNSNFPSRTPEVSPDTPDRVVRLFIGEATADDATIIEAAGYAVNGIYTSEWYPVVTNTSYLRRHSLGCELYSVTNYVNRTPRMEGRREENGPGYYLMTDGSSRQYGAARRGLSVNTLVLQTMPNYITSPGNATENGDAVSGFYQTVVKRMF